CGTPPAGARSATPPARHHDHITPHAAGGPTSIDNGQGTCALCNQKERHLHHVTRETGDPDDPGAVTGTGETGASGDTGPGRSGPPHPRRHPHRPPRRASGRARRGHRRSRNRGGRNRGGRNRGGRPDRPPRSPQRHRPGEPLCPNTSHPASTEEPATATHAPAVRPAFGIEEDRAATATRTTPRTRS